MNLKNFIKIGKIGTFDIEANRWVDFVAGGVYDGNKYRYFLTAEEMFRYILRPIYKNYRFYAHFGGRYDYLFLLEYLFNNRDKYAIELTFQSSRILYMKVTDKTYYDSKSKTYPYVWYFLDSYSLLPTSLKKLSKSFNVKHQKKEFDFTEDLKVTRELLEYLEYDVKGLYEIIHKFAESISKFDTRLRMTIASQSQDIFFNNFSNRLIFGNRKYENIERQAYYGGRTEVIKRKYDKEKPLYYYDINSLYPYIMKTKIIPFGTPHKIINPKINKLNEYEGIAYATIENYDYIPIIPKRHNDRLMFGIGKFKGYYALPEIRKAIDKGYNVKIHKLWNYPIRDYIFKDYIDYFYKIKQQADKDSPDYLLSKLFMNSLYGKFAQRREVENVKINPKNKIGMTLENEQFDIWKEKTINDSKNIIPIIAVYITSYARLELYDYIELVGYNNIYYMDTDSIFTTKKIPTSSILGKMKLENKIKKAIFMLPKVYSYIDYNDYEETKIKGFDKSNFRDINNRVINYNLMEKAFNNEIILKQHFSKVMGFKSAVKRFNAPLSLAPYKKTLNNEYIKRQVLEDKINTIPNMFKGDKIISYDYKKYKFQNYFDEV